MRLHTHTWGGGDRVAVLLHGMNGSGRSWHAVGPALAGAYAAQKAGRTLDALAVRRPEWSTVDVAVEAEAAEQWDVTTAAALATAAAGRDFMPPMAGGRVSVPSMVLHAEPSQYLSHDDLAALRERCFTVRGITGAGHSVWYGHLPEFLAVLDEWLVDPEAERTRASGAR